MKFVLCKSFETSDEEGDEEDEGQEEEENVSEAEQNEGSNASGDEEESAGSSEEYDASTDAADADEAHAKYTSPIKKGTALKLNGKSSGEIKKTNGKSSGNDSASSDTESSVRAENGKLETDERQIQFNGATLLSNTKSTATTNGALSRNKNVSTETMVMTAIRSLNERGGSSAIAIKKYIMNNFPKSDEPRTLMLIKKFLKKALLSGKLVQTKGTGVGGSFKISPEQNKLEKKKQVEKRKKPTQKTKKDAPADKADGKTKAAIKAKTKKSEKSEPKTATNKKISKIKSTTTSTLKVENGSGVSQKVPKTSAVLKKVPKMDELKPPKKVATKNAKSSPIVAVLPKPSRNAKVASSATTMPTMAEKPKKASPVKSASIADVSVSPIKTGPKVKSTPYPKKKAAGRGKPAVPDIDEITEDGGGDADTVKPAAKKTAAKKGKAK